MDKVDFFTMPGEDGQDHDFMYLDTIEIDGQKYWICEEAFFEDGSEEIVLGETVAFKVIEEKGEDVILDSIDDDAEFEKVAKAWEEIEEDFDIDEESEYEFEETEDEEK
jgi:hypothetical protein